MFISCAQYFFFTTLKLLFYYCNFVLFSQNVGTCYVTLSLLAATCCLLITFANSLDPDQDRQNIGPNPDPSCWNSGSVPERILECYLGVLMGIQINKNFGYKIVKIFLSISLNICFGYSKELSHWDDFLQYPQHMFWSRNKKINFW